MRISAVALMVSTFSAQPIYCSESESFALPSHYCQESTSHLTLQCAIFVGHSYFCSHDSNRFSQVTSLSALVPINWVGGAARSEKNEARIVSSHSFTVSGGI